MSLKNSLIVSSVFLAVAALSGCVGVDEYASNSASAPIVSFHKTTGKSVAVLPLSDARTIKGVKPDSGSFVFGLIPLCPYSHVNKSIPEKSSGFASLDYFHFDPVNDFAASVYESLKKSNLFTKVERATSSDKTDADFIFEADFSNTDYDGYVITYGITYFLAPALWSLGCPYGVSENTLHANFSLRDRKSGETVWTYSYKGKDSLTHWIYARMGKDCSIYPGLIRNAMNAALSNMNQTLPQ